jgi:hypothetical protein
MDYAQYGVFSMSPEGPFEAGAYTTIVFKVKIGSKGIKRGGRFKIAPPNMGWGEPLCLKSRDWDEIIEETEREHNPWKPINTKGRVKSKGKAWLALRADESVLHLPPGTSACVDENALIYDQWRWWITAKVEGDDLHEGDEIEVIYGDTEEHAHGIKVQPWPEEGRLWFGAVVDPEGDKHFYPLAGAPFDVKVLPGPPEKVKAVLPSICSVGKKVALRTAVLDRNLCPPSEEYGGDLTLEKKKGEVLFHGTNTVEALDNGITNVYVTGPEKVKTNPMLVEAKNELNLYWGDLHAQSRYHQWRPPIKRGDSSLSPAELHAYARDCSMLDFVALTDGSGAYATSPGWEETQIAANELYEPGRYVPFKGWECGMDKQGDKCVVYRSAEIEDNVPFLGNDKTVPSLSHALTKFYKNHRERVLTIPHSFMKYLDWSVLDPELDRVMEIYSCWGGYESREDNPLNSKRQPKNQSAQYILGQGVLLGITAAGDSHLGYPGRSLSYSDRYWCQCFKAGLCGVYSKELTRESVWDAIYDRHCYGTTGERIILKFDLNGNRMGSILEYSDENALVKRNLKIFVAGTDYIRRVDIMKNNALLYRHEPESDCADFVYEDILDEAPKTRDWYYVRVFQADGNAAWSSPIWVSPENCSEPSRSMGE